MGYSKVIIIIIIIQYFIVLYPGLVPIEVSFISTFTPIPPLDADAAICAGLRACLAAAAIGSCAGTKPEFAGAQDSFAIEHQAGMGQGEGLDQSMPLQPRRARWRSTRNGGPGGGYPGGGLGPPGGGGGRGGPGPMPENGQELGMYPDGYPSHPQHPGQGGTHLGPNLTV